MTTTIEKIPTYFLPFFINNDTEGYAQNELDEANEWLEKSGVKEVVSPTDESYEPYFSFYPAFGQATEVVDCTCILEY